MQKTFPVQDIQILVALKLCNLKVPLPPQNTYFRDHIYWTFLLEENRLPFMDALYLFLFFARLGVE